MAHIYADNRSDLMFAAGYAQAQERLFLMDVIRRTAEGTLAGLLGPSAAPGDASQLTNQDFSPQELTDQTNRLPAQYGAVGAARLQRHPELRGRDQRLHQRGEDRPGADARRVCSAGRAAGTLDDRRHGGRGGVPRHSVHRLERLGGGQRAAPGGLHAPLWTDAGASSTAICARPTTPKRSPSPRSRFHSDNPGRVEPRLHLNAWLDLGSIKPRNAEVQGPDAAKAAELRSRLPAWVRSLERLRTALPHVESNALMLTARLSADGHALAAMGPQVGYYSPQIFSEYELHGGGIDSEGVTFPGASPWPLIGHGIDFAWSGTSANGDNEDTFVERLCNPDGSAPSDASTHYRYKGKCIPFVMRDQSVTTPVAPTSPSPSQTITYRTMRSVHGPVFAFATVRGAPVALTVAKAVDFHEVSAALPFMELSENDPTSVRSFMRIMGQFPGSENWFYVDRHDVGWIQSGVYPKHAAHSDVDLPWWGDGRADWRCFNPTTYTACYIPASHRPQAIDPRDGFIISWNNVEARGWHPPPTGWGTGPLDHALILQQRLKWELAAHHGRIDIGEIAQDANQTATTDLRGLDDYPWMRRVIGKAPGQAGQILALIDALAELRLPSGWRRPARTSTPTARRSRCSTPGGHGS